MPTEFGLGSFGDWLAGFIDGEGCFLISRRRGSWFCHFRIVVRGDDEPVLVEIARRTAIGNVSWYAPKVGSAQAAWNVSSRNDCIVLASILREHPLRAKKIRDFDVWSEALRVHRTVRRGGSKSEVIKSNASKWVEMERLTGLLKSGRIYTCL